MTIKFIYITLLILISALSRLLPHPPEFTPVIAICIFAGATLFSKREAILIPILSMFLSDIFLGFHSLMPVIYLTMALISILSFYYLREKNIFKIFTMGVGAGILFYIVTNFAVWISSSMYSFDLNGLIQCYTAAIPFFRSSLAGILIYSSILFSAIYLFEKFAQTKVKVSA